MPIARLKRTNTSSYEELTWMDKYLKGDVPTSDH